MVDGHISVDYPGVVVIGQKMDFRFREACPQMRKHGRREQQVA
jgi:hypothetical protein